MKYEIYALGILVAVISFLGFVVENIWLAMTKGYINNRNMNAPFLLGYGLLIVVFYLILGTPNRMVLPLSLQKKLRKRGKYILYFFCALLAVCICEIVLGGVVEKLCGIEYWNYDKTKRLLLEMESAPKKIGALFL